MGKIISNGQVMQTVSFYLTEAEATALKELAKARGTSVNRFLGDYVRSQFTGPLQTQPTKPAPTPSPVLVHTPVIVEAPKARDWSALGKTTRTPVSAKPEIPAVQWFKDQGLNPKLYKMELFEDDTYDELDQHYKGKPKMCLDFAKK